MKAPAVPWDSRRRKSEEASRTTSGKLRPRRERDKQGKASTEPLVCGTQSPQNLAVLHAGTPGTHPRPGLLAIKVSLQTLRQGAHHLPCVHLLEKRRASIIQMGSLSGRPLVLPSSIEQSTFSFFPTLRKTPWLPCNLSPHVPAQPPSPLQASASGHPRHLPWLLGVDPGQSPGGRKTICVAAAFSQEGSRKLRSFSIKWEMSWGSTS